MGKDFANSHEKVVSLRRTTCKNCKQLFMGASGWLFCCSWCREDFYASERLRRKSDGSMKDNRGSYHRGERVKKVYVKKDYPWKHEIRTCPICSSEFSPVGPNNRFCSRECGRLSVSFEYNIKNNTDHMNAGFNKLRFEVFKRDNFTCTYCGRNVKDDKIKLHCDHIHPKSNGGLDALENLTTSCEDCNLGKADVLLGYKLIK